MIFIGRLAPVKGLRVLIESFAGLLKTHPDAQLIVVGNGPDHNWLAHQAKGFGNSLVLTGTLSQAEVANELAQSHALVLPSFAEGVPVVLMEAMAAGRPVIATQVAGVSELVENGVNGFIVPPGDAVGLTARMQDLADDPALRRRMGAAGRETVRAEFDIRHEAARLKSLFEGRMGASPRPSPTPRNSHATRHSD